MISEVHAKWQAAQWSVISETIEPPAMHVALDESLLNSVIAGRRGPTLRFWAWASPAVIIGRFQSLKNEVDSLAARDLNVTVVRRLSGGGAMYVRPDASITYSLYVPEDLLAGMSIRDSYAFCDSWVVQSLRELGADVSYVPLNDIASPQGKVGGAAQARRPGAVLHHTTIAWIMNADEMMRVLRIGREKISDKGIASAAKRVHPLSEQVSQDRGSVVAELERRFRNQFSCAADDITSVEYEAANALMSNRYGTEEWTRELE